MVNPLEFPFAYRCPFCEKQTFFFKEKPIAGMKIMAKDIYYQDGAKPASGDRIVCRICRGVLNGLFTRLVEPTEKPEGGTGI